MAIARFIIIYNADGGLLGELRYFAGKLSGTSACAACTLTHGTLSEKDSWKSCKQELSVPVDQLHRNETSTAMRDAIALRHPCVLAQHNAAGLTQEFEFLLGPAELAALEGDEQGLADVLQRALRDHAAI